MEPTVKKLSELELADKGILTWPVWTKEISTFPYHYDTEEQCYLVEGDVVITTDENRTIDLHPGDFVTFPQGLTCTWTITSPVKKHYHLS